MSSAQLRSIYSRARQLDFSPSPWGGIKDLLALVAVTAGFKPIAAFGFLSENNEGEIRNLRDRIVDLGLKTQITTFIHKPSARHLDGFPAEVVRAFQVFDGEKDQGRRDYLLWVARDSSAVSAVKMASSAPASVGVFLGYPACCVEHEEHLHCEMQRALAKAYIEAVGPQTEKVLSALRNDLGVEVEITGKMTLWQTDQAYPFVFHSACEHCLAANDSPTASINEQNEGLAADLDPALHRTIIEMAKLEVQLGQVCSVADEKGLSPESIDQQTKERLQNLSERCDHLAQVFKTGAYPRQSLIGGWD